MISFASPLPIGDAVKVGFVPPAGAIQTIVLRKLADNFTGHNDPAALVVYDGDESEPFFIDTSSLTNGTPYFYHEYDSADGVTWSDGGASVSATPAATALDASVDVLELLRSRLAAGLKNEVVAGNLTNVDGYIPVLTAPPLADNVQFPIVTVHMHNDSGSVRGLGEVVAPDYQDPISGLWISGEGWLSAYQVDIFGWVSGNPDERNTLRKAIKKVIIGNLPVFDAAGIVQPQLSMSDTEDFESYNAPMYQAICSFTCLAPSVIYETGLAAVSDVNVNAMAA